eukprot:15706555-Heterocapsa_arctica.AAC.1
MIALMAGSRSRSPRQTPWIRLRGGQHLDAELISGRLSPLGLVLRGFADDRIMAKQPFAMSSANCLVFAAASEDVNTLTPQSFLAVAVPWEWSCEVLPMIASWPGSRCDLLDKLLGLRSRVRGGQHLDAK